MNKEQESPRINNILWLDCIGGLVIGVIVLLASELLSQWDGLPTGVIRFVGFANLAYGSYSIWVATRNPRLHLHRENPRSGQYGLAGCLHCHHCYLLE